MLEPFAALKFAAQQRKAEALSAKLCHTGDEFIYEITLLHRDGRLIRVQMEAGTGKLIARQPREPREPHETAVTREFMSPLSPANHMTPRRLGQETDWGQDKRTLMRLLVVEDDRDLNRQISSALEAAGYAVDRAFDGEEGWFRGDTEPYDAVVLDIGLPKRDGISILEAWRKAGRSMPVLILTARDRWSDKVQGIDAGADDYVAKPFHMEEVLARLRALLRRAAGHATSDLMVGPVRLDARAGRVTVNGEPVKLTSHEYRLLSYLMHHAGRIISRSEIVEHLYEQDFDRDSNTIEVFIGRLRKKLGVDIIKTARGLGYLVGIDAEAQDFKIGSPGALNSFAPRRNRPRRVSRRPRPRRLLHRPPPSPLRPGGQVPRCAPSVPSAATSVAL